MRLDDEICRRAGASSTAQVSSELRAGPRASRAGSQSPCGRNRSDTRGARGRHCRISQYPDSKSRTNCRTNRFTTWKDSCRNHPLYRGTLWSHCEKVDSHCHFEQVTESEFDRVFRWLLVSTVECLSPPEHILRKSDKTPCRGIAQ